MVNLTFVLFILFIGTQCECKKHKHFKKGNNSTTYMCFECLDCTGLDVKMSDSVCETNTGCYTYQTKEWMYIDKDDMVTTSGCLTPTVEVFCQTEDDNRINDCKICWSDLCNKPGVASGRMKTKFQRKKQKKTESDEVEELSSEGDVRWSESTDMTLKAKVLNKKRNMGKNKKMKKLRSMETVAKTSKKPSIDDSKRLEERVPARMNPFAVEKTVRIGAADFFGDKDSKAPDISCYYVKLTFVLFCIFLRQ